MRSCPHCQTAPQWHFARNYSAREKAQFFLIEGCRHSESFARPFGFVADAGRPTFESAWDAEAERLFAEYTADPSKWTDPKRTHFRVRLGWITQPTELPLLTQEQIAATKAYSEAHPASAEDFGDVPASHT
jgi:hypothetical protein